MLCQSEMIRKNGCNRSNWGDRKQEKVRKAVYVQEKTDVLFKKKVGSDVEKLIMMYKCVIYRERKKEEV